MKVKNVIKGLNQKYDLEEITIIDADRVCFSGDIENWRTPVVDMVLYKKQIMEREVIGRLVHCNRKAFIFIGNPCNREHHSM